MLFNNYNKLLETSDLNNFHLSLDKPNGYTFNHLINILKEEGIPYEVIKGFDYNSNNQAIKNFNEITFKINDSKWKEICEIYSLSEVFNIKQNKNEYTLKINNDNMEV